MNETGLFLLDGRRFHALEGRRAIDESIAAAGGAVPGFGRTGAVRTPARDGSFDHVDSKGAELRERIARFTPVHGSAELMSFDEGSARRGDRSAGGWCAVARPSPTLLDGRYHTATAALSAHVVTLTLAVVTLCIDAERAITL